MNHEYDPNQQHQQQYQPQAYQQQYGGQQAYPPPQPGYPPPGQPYPQQVPGGFYPAARGWDADNPDARMWAMLAHLSGLFFGFLGPLVVFLVKKDESPFVADQAREALNFQISLAIYLIVSTISIIALIGVLLLPAVAIFGLVIEINAALKANTGVAYRCPLTIRFVQ